MGRYSFVKDQTGSICGIWLQDAGYAQNREHLVMFTIAESLSMDVYINVQEGNYRVVANTFDNAGGCFVMFGSTPAPGEKSETKSEEQSSTNERKNPESSFAYRLGRFIRKILGG